MRRFEMTNGVELWLRSSAIMAIHPVEPDMVDGKTCCAIWLGNSLSFTVLGSTADVGNILRGITAPDLGDR